MGGIEEEDNRSGNDESKEELDSSDISGLDSFARTQYATRNNVGFKRMEEESLNLTPESNGGALTWKSNLTRAAATNRTTASDITNKSDRFYKPQRAEEANLTQRVVSMRHNSSLQRDPELEEAIREPKEIIQ